MGRNAAFLPSSAAALLLALASGAAAAAQDFPKLKPGLWEMTTSSSGAPNQKSKSTLCLDASIQQEVIRMSSGMMATACSRSEMKMVGNKFTAVAECNIAGSTMKSKSVMTMNGDASYHTEAEATFSPPLGGEATSKAVIDGRHIGACKPGQQPGDLTTPNGMTINIRNAMSGKK